MGDRYTISAPIEALQKRFGVEVGDWYEQRYNAAPTQLLPVITQGSKGISMFHWGQIPGWSKNKTISGKLIFAEQETLMEKTSSKIALQSSRCLIPADGYYDWKKISKKGRVAHRLIFGNNDIVGFAGLWEEFEDDKEEVAHTFKIITTAANGVIAPMNHRMPAIIAAADEKAWLDQNTTAEKALELIKSYPASSTSMYSVSPKIEQDIDNEYLIKPFAPADQFGNYSLFD
jgi:putative SOS response-associated peptidase YedK